jgi:hypothetical protein
MEPMHVEMNQFEKKHAIKSACFEKVNEDLLLYMRFTTQSMKANWIQKSSSFHLMYQRPLLGLHRPQNRFAWVAFVHTTTAS